jgi:hypothetical protein
MDNQVFWDLEMRSGKYAYISTRYTRKKKGYTEKMWRKRNKIWSRDDSGQDIKSR